MCELLLSSTRSHNTHTEAPRLTHIALTPITHTEAPPLHTSLPYTPPLPYTPVVHGRVAHAHIYAPLVAPEKKAWWSTQVHPGG